MRHLAESFSANKEKTNIRGNAINLMPVFLLQVLQSHCFLSMCVRERENIKEKKRASTQMSDRHLSTFKRKPRVTNPPPPLSIIRS